MPQQASQVVIIILSGLSAEALIDLEVIPTLDRLRDAGASSTLISQAPSFRYTSWNRMLSGAPADINNSPPFDVTLNRVPPLQINHILQNAQAQGQRSAVLGQAAWQNLLPDNTATYQVLTENPDADGDEEVLARFPILLADPDLQLIVLQLNQIHHAAQLNGVESDAFTEAAARVDSRLNSLLDQLNLNRATVIITADHGHINRGGYGGGDAAVTNLPLIMLGATVIPGTYSPVQQIDLAPTVAALLGQPYPTHTQGRPLFEMLQVDERLEAQAWVRLARQRFRLLDLYTAYLGEPAPNPESLSRTQNFLENQNYNGASQLAQQLVTQTDAEIDRLRTVYRHQGWPGRLALIVGIVLLAALAIRWLHSELWGDALFAAGVTIGSYHSLYLLDGWPYSLSAINTPAQLWLEPGQRMALSLLLGSLVFLFLLILQQITDNAAILHGSYEFVFFTSGGFALPALYGFWQHGWRFIWTLPDAAVYFWHLTALVQSFLVVILGAFVPLLILLLNAPLQRLQSLYQQRQIERLKQRTRPDANVDEKLRWR